MFCFRAYGLVSPIYIYKYYNILFSHNKENFKNNICISMHFGFNNQFIQAMRTRPIFQSFCPLLVYGITNLYVKRIPDIKNMIFT